MKTHEEIKKGLECCNGDAIGCEFCPYHSYLGNGCTLLRNADAIAYIKQLEDDRKERDILADAYQELEANQPKWISMEDALPENDDDVLIITEFGISIGYYDVYQDYWVDYTNGDSNIVTHWMPLPPAPKEECNV